LGEFLVFLEGESPKHAWIKPWIRWSTGIECDTLFPFSFLSTPFAFWSWADLT